MNERERYAAALIVVAQYFSSSAGRPIADRFFELASAIADLNNGTVHPLLEPVRPDNRPADPSQLWRARARVALGLEALLRAGLNRSAAAAKIASHYSSVANLAGVKAKGSKLQTIVFGWRRELKAGRVKNFEAGELFSEGSKESIDWRLRKTIESSRIANLPRLPSFRVCFPPLLNTHKSPLGLPQNPGKSRPNEVAMACILMERNDGKIQAHRQQLHKIVIRPDRSLRTGCA